MIFPLSELVQDCDNDSQLLNSTKVKARSESFIKHYIAVRVAGLSRGFEAKKEVRTGTLRLLRSSLVV